MGKRKPILIPGLSHRALWAAIPFVPVTGPLRVTAGRDRHSVGASWLSSFGESVPSPGWHGLGIVLGVMLAAW
jgi:hypothetical protein